MNLLKSLDKVNLLKSLDRDIYAISNGIKSKVLSLNILELSLNILKLSLNILELSLNILELSIFGEKWHLTALILGVVPVET